MRASDLFVLAQDVELIPVNSISEEWRKKFEYDAGDVVITIQNSRINSKVISAEFAELLEEFRSPKTIAEVISNYSNRHQLDSLELADESISQWLKLKNAGFLVPYSSDQVALSRSTFNPGDIYRGYTIIKKKFESQDTEVYQVQDCNGNHFALKWLKGMQREQIKTVFENEVRILQQLDGTVNPSLKEHGVDSENFFLIMEWCYGLNCINEASRYRNINHRKNIVALLDISIAISKALFHLHQQGILHGDIHPRNIFISGKDKVKIIDYGYSAKKEDQNRIQRAGTGFFYEPEFAKAVVNKKRRPALTESSEQYSAAAVLYKVITGRDYLNYSFDESKIYHQIMSDELIPFRENDLVLPKPLEQILARALSKRPEDRYSSLIDLANALVEVRSDVLNSADFFAINRENSEEEFVDFLIRRFGWDSAAIENGFQLSPTCSVNHGAAGIAYFFYRLACVRKNSSFAALADVWISRASQFKNHSTSFLSSELGIKAETVGKISIYHSPTGIHLTKGLINSASGDYDALSQSLDNFVTASNEPCDKIELALGKGGILTGCSLLLRELRPHLHARTLAIESLGRNVTKEIWSQMDQLKPINSQNELNYFGVAHGWAGLLFATLQWCSISNQELPTNFLTRLEQLLDCAVYEKNTIYWPHSILNETPWKGWCNGSAGHIFLWILCYQYFGDEKFLQVAEGLANHVTQQSDGYNCNLCCGLTGQAYALMALYKITGKQNHFNNVKLIKKTLLKNLFSPQIANNGLYKGQTGPGVLFCESESPMLARMPLFE